MNFEWVQWSNSVAVWWIFLASIGSVNIMTWIWSFSYLKRRGREAGSDPWVRSLIWLSAVYVFVCAFRSFLPRADVQKIVLFDTWWSSVLVGRTVATVAELCFVAQWAIVLRILSSFVNSPTVFKMSQVFVPLIVVAECFSWYSVITTHYLGNTVEESIWAMTYALIGVCLVLLFPKFVGPLKTAIGFSIFGCVLYVFFMVTVDVPMYLGRWQDDNESGKEFLGLVEGFHRLNTQWIVTHDIKDWKTEIPWKSLYFSIAVWVSLALCYVPLSRERIEQYRAR
jgi:hypothetical protein